MQVLEQWQQQARSVGFFDSDYPSSQLWKQEWETCNGDQVALRARQAIDMLEPLRVQTGDVPQ